MAAGIPVRKTWTALRQQYPDLLLTKQDIRNLNSSWQAVLDGGLPAIQALIKTIEASSSYGDTPSHSASIVPTKPIDLIYTF